MNDAHEKLNRINEKLDDLLQKQFLFAKEINELRGELNRIKSSQKEPSIKTPKIVEESPENQKNGDFFIPAETPPDNFKIKESIPPVSHKPIFPHRQFSMNIKSDIEKFIGENLINKIGIVITVIGVGIGAKYSIDHDLINPLTRIILGYLIGLGLLGISIRLRNSYENFSAVLVSGAMAIMYFITYSAYGFYSLIPQSIAFILMVLFTVFTVFAALNFNKQVIAHIGLVGAYAVPFLLSDNSGRVLILFSYIAIINTGILVLAVKKYWKPLYYSAFLLTWLIYFSWFVINYRITEHFGLSLIFLSIYFILFYLTFLSYKLLQNEKFISGDVLLLLTNSFIYFGIGYSILQEHKIGSQLLGAFTIGNALVHFIVSSVIYRQKLADRNLFFLVSGLVLVFTTIAIPIQLDGNWVTLLWAGEALLLFWIGRTKNVPFYEKLSYIVMIPAFFSIVHDWFSISIDSTHKLTPFINIHFLSSLLFTGAFGFINLFFFDKKFVSEVIQKARYRNAVSIFIPAVFITCLYFTFSNEISLYWDQLFAGSLMRVKVPGQEYFNYFYNVDLNDFKIIWLINYSLFFFSVLSYTTINIFKNRTLGMTSLGLNVLTLIIFLTIGLSTLSELRDSYLNNTLGAYYHHSDFNIGIRYIAYIFVALLLMMCRRYVYTDFLKIDLRIPVDFLIHGTVLWITSSELINLLALGSTYESNKLGLSILWGLYALLLIVMGIVQKQKHLRIGAILLFAVTLIKLFFYDISYLSTISKTIVFISLGILLLIISFLYNKYKYLISDEH